MEDYCKRIKTYSQLKTEAERKIAEWMFQATRDYYMKQCTFPNDKHLEEVVDSVYEKKKIVSLPAVYVGSYAAAGNHSGCICTRNG